MPRPSFRDLEYQGWMNRAEVYDDYFAGVTRQAIPAILQSFGDLQSLHLLDVSCGTGHLSAAAADHGARVSGLDFAAAMIRQARRNYPRLVFIEGDAGQLPYRDGLFDAVACSFGIHHLPDPAAGLREACRVLKPGGRFSFTVWASPEQGNAFVGALRSAIAMHGAATPGLPDAPPMPEFTEGMDHCPELSRAGFEDCVVRLIPLVWQAERAEDALEMIYRSMVRVPMMLEAQPEAARARVHEEFLRSLRGYETGGVIRVPFTAVLVTAKKPG